MPLFSHLGVDQHPSKNCPGRWRRIPTLSHTPTPIMERSHSTSEPHLPHQRHRRAGRRNLIQCVDLVADLTGAAREATLAIVGDTGDGTPGKRYTICFAIEHDGKSYPRQLYMTTPNPSEHPRKIALDAEHYVRASYEDRSFYEEDDEIPFGEAEGISVQHMLTIDDDGYPVLIDPGDYRD